MDSFPAIKITEFERYDYSDRNITNALDIAYGIDRNYLDWVGVSITSIVINNNINIEYHIICDEYDACFLERIASLAKKYQIKISLYLINSECLADLPSTKVWSRAMYFRLFAFEYFSNKLDKLLYLDADVFCKGRLDELAACNLKDVAAAVVRDVDSMQNKAAERLKDPGIKDNYFNSGVVLANLKEWVRNDLTNRTFSILLNDDSKGIKYKYPDQDVLNVLLKDKVLYLPSRFNTIYTIKSELKDRTHQQYKQLIHDDTVLIHYTGATKPWHKWATYPSTVYYQQALAASPWKDQPPRDARTFIEFKKRYKHLLIQHKYYAGLIAGFQYLLRKYSLYQN
ncbi:glycosyltransferase [Kosakonia sp. H02]|nr:glycosyltransferase [Kosakonia sp. H02]